MKQISLGLLVVISMISCNSSGGKYVAKHDTADVFYTNPLNGGKGLATGIYNPNGIFVLENQKDSSSTKGKWDTAWVINIPDSARDPRTNVAILDSAHHARIIDRWYTIDHRFVTIDPNGRHYNNK